MSIRRVDIWANNRTFCMSLVVCWSHPYLQPSDRYRNPQRSHPDRDSIDISWRRCSHPCSPIRLSPTFHHYNIRPATPSTNTIRHHEPQIRNLERVFLKFDSAWWITASPLEPPDVYTFLPPITPPSAPKQLLTMFSLAGLPLHGQPVLAVYLADAWPIYIASESTVAVADLLQTHYLLCLPN